VAGVPTDRRQAAEAELEPVFAALADAVRAADEERRRATAEAYELVAGAKERAGSIVAHARSEAEAVRSAEEVRVRSEASAEAARMAEQAAADAHSARSRAALRRTELVSLVVARVRADIAEAARTDRRTPDEDYQR
jgi:hypothetical protein